MQSSREVGREAGKRAGKICKFAPRLYLNHFSTKCFDRPQAVKEICKFAPRLYLTRKIRCQFYRLQVCTQGGFDYHRRVFAKIRHEVWLCHTTRPDTSTGAETAQVSAPVVVPKFVPKFCTPPPRRLFLLQVDHQCPAIPHSACTKAFFVASRPSMLQCAAIPHSAFI